MSRVVAQRGGEGRVVRGPRRRGERDASPHGERHEAVPAGEVDDRSACPRPRRGTYWAVVGFWFPSKPPHR